MVESSLQKPRENYLVRAKKKDRSEWPNRERIIICDRCGGFYYVVYPKKYDFSKIEAQLAKDFPFCPGVDGPRLRHTHKLSEGVEYFGWELRANHDVHFFEGLHGMQEGGHRRGKPPLLSLFRAP